MADVAPTRLAPTAIAALFRSMAHNYFGHFQRPPGSAPMLAEPRIDLVAGAGIVGDRFFSYKPGYAGQVTFFAIETYEHLQAELDCSERSPAVFRRNILTRGVDLLALIGREFEIQGVRFFGAEYCKPCFWMDQAFAPGAFGKLVAWQAGGLRAQVLSDGCLTTPSAEEASCLAS